MINSERIFDALPYALDIYEKLNFEAYREKAKEKKNVNATDIGIDVFKHIIKNSTKIKEEFFNLVAVVEGKKVEEIKEQSFVLTVKAFMSTFQEIMQDKELNAFFN